MRRVLVIGGGSIGERHVRCFQNTRRAEMLLCEIQDDVRSEIAARYSIDESFNHLETALDADFDAAVICTPAHLHIPMALQLARRGVDLLIEKPLSTSLTDVNNLVDVVGVAKTKVSIAYVSRVHPALKAMKQALDSDRFGRPVQIVATSGQHFPFYRPAYRDIYYASRKTGGGAIQDAFTHLINLAEWFVGPVTRVAADAAHCVLEGVEVEDTVHAITRHDSVLGSFSLNQHQAPNETLFSVICEKGALRCEISRNRWLSAVEPGTDWEIEETFKLERDDLFVRQADEFLDLLSGDALPTCSLSAGIQTLRTNLALLEASEKQVWVNIARS